MFIQKFFNQSIIRKRSIFTVALLLVSQIVVQIALYAGVSDHLARETKIKYFEGNNVSTFSQYSELTYLIELVALGLVALALLAVTISVFSRLKSGKKEQKKILQLRRSAECDKKALDRTIIEIDNAGKQLEASIDETSEYVKIAADKAQEAEKHAESIETIEIEMKQLVDGTTERMSHIQKHWEQMLKETTESMDQIKASIEESVSKAISKNASVSKVNDSQDDATTTNKIVQTEAINGEIKKTLDLTLIESRELLSQIKDYQQQAESAFLSFKNTLGGFESQAHEQFDEIFNTADMARQELNANLDESREYMKIFRRNNAKSEKEIGHIDRDKRKQKSTQIANDRNKSIHLETDRSVRDAGSMNSLPDNGDKNLLTLFTNYKT